MVTLGQHAHPGSWVIRNKTTGAVICEVFSRKTIDALNTNKFEAVPILQYLQEINQQNRPSHSDA